ncbi:MULTISPECIES: hypothetical protein [Undibacterium]|uniref:Uncharacterized protein n=1 Tax=Undibacterium parvum TaxID=401471 RepID=A0A3Q9BSP6_9BURK|nr:MULTISPECIES: hypothetical protein [Undibacterium]AZP13652.1 hypothetical protein EJN92_17680 [Undibacterium parvum]MCX7219249.1 hypothetical protein [Burkholderiales bacterium]
MEWLKQNQKKSLLGQLLVSKKLISEQQLTEAIKLQKETGQRLGDIFAEWNLITQRQIQGILRKQRTLRLTATIASSLLAPIQAYAAVVPAPVTQLTQTSNSQGQNNWRTLTEQELSEISGQGILDDTLNDALNLNLQNNNNNLHNRQNQQVDLQQRKDPGLQVLGSVAKLMNPLLMMLDAKTTIKDVVYDSANAAAVINKDGSITLNLPSSIGEMKFENIRIKGSTGPSFGSIDIKGIDLRGTTLTIKAH